MRLFFASATKTKPWWSTARPVGWAKIASEPLPTNVVTTPPLGSNSSVGGTPTTSEAACTKPEPTGPAAPHSSAVMDNCVALRVAHLTHAHVLHSALPDGSVGGAPPKSADRKLPFASTSEPLGKPTTLVENERPAGSEIVENAPTPSAALPDR